ncbi:hypothetical protein thsrh120_62790 [Rhizobium sp. No.120]
MGSCLRSCSHWQVREVRAYADDSEFIPAGIDNIAFQTNLLALNAAAEAVCAGKGLAVVEASDWHTSSLR